MRGRGLLSLLFSAMIAMACSQARAASQPTSTWEQITTTKTLRLGVASAEPWYFKDGGGAPDAGTVGSGGDLWRGVGPVLAKQIADAMGVKLDLVETTWPNAVAGLQSNQFDLMFILDPTPQRALSIDFPPSPVLWYPLALLGGDDAKVTTWADVNDPKYRVGVTLGTAQDQYVSRVIPKAAITRFGDNGAVIAAYQARRVDFACLTAPAADLARARLRAGQTIVPKPVNAVAAGAAIRQEADARWRDYLTTVVSYYYNTGRTQEIYDQYMRFRGLDPAKATPIIKENWSR